MRNAQKALWLLSNGHQRPLLRGIPPAFRCDEPTPTRTAPLQTDAPGELSQTRATPEPAPSAKPLRGNVASLGDPAARQRDALTDHEAALVTREEHGEHRVFAGGAEALSRHLAP
jgi:hypothetical protein